MNWLVLTVALALTTAIVEAGLRVKETLTPQPENQQHTEATMRLHMPSTDAVLRYETRPGSVVERDGTIYRINAEGLRRTENLGAKDHRRILLLGDSVAFGFGIGEAETFAQRIERRLSGTPTEVLNHSVLGYRTEQEVRLFELRGPKLRPDAVVLAFCLNDFDVFSGELPLFDPRSRLELGFRRMAPRRTLGADWPEPLPLFDDSLLFRKTTSRLFRVDYYRWIATDRDRVNEVTTALRKLSALLRREGIPGLVVIFPLLIEDSRGNYPYGDLHQVVAEAASAAGLPTADLLVPLRRHGLTRLRLKASDDLHLNTEGHSLAADALTPCFSDPFLRCSAIN